MTLRTTALILAASLAGSAAPADRPGDAAALDPIRLQYQAYEGAYRGKDVKTLMALTTPNFTVRLPNGRGLSRKQLGEMLKRQFAAYKFPPMIEVRVDRVIVRGGTADAVTHGRFVDLVDDPQGKTHQVKGESAERDAWVKTPAGWLLRKRVITRIRYTRDGKPFDPYAEPAIQPGVKGHK